MHFAIISIESLQTDRADWTDNLDYEDETLNANADYFGEMYSAEDRKRYIQGSSLARLLDGIATVDAEKETITFLDADTINKTIQDYFRDKVQELADKALLSGWDFRNAGREWRDFDTMFWNNLEWCGYGQTSVGFVESAPYFAGKTVAIGNIFDGHF